MIVSGFADRRTEEKPIPAPLAEKHNEPMVFLPSTPVLRPRLHVIRATTRNPSDRKTRPRWAGTSLEDIDTSVSSDRGDSTVSSDPEDDLPWEAGVKRHHLLEVANYRRGLRTPISEGQPHHGVT